MVKAKRSVEELLRRYVWFIISLFVIALGTSMSIRANLGSSPISCPPYALSVREGAWTMGTYVMCMHVLFVVAQVLLLRKDFQIIQLLQFAVSLLFGVFTDVTMWMTSYLQVDMPSDPNSSLFTLHSSLIYAVRAVELLIGNVFLAAGICMEMHCDVLLLAGEGFPLAIAKVLRRDFSSVKICTDTLLVAFGLAFMLIYFHHWRIDIVGFGTVISMFFVGFMVRQINPHTHWLDRTLVGEPGAAWWPLRRIIVQLRKLRLYGYK